ncbi:MAG: hypothetical protein FWE60_00475 [Oscillospiraceae bacterium]|nr:hypothetical protein [Oscillospiraceae bacterium]
METFIGVVFIALFVWFLVVLSKAIKLKKSLSEQKSVHKHGYPSLSFAKVILRIEGLLCIIFGAVIGERFGNVAIGLLFGFIFGIGSFIIAEVIQLFVDMGKNVENLTENVQMLAERENNIFDPPNDT